MRDPAASSYDEVIDRTCRRVPELLRRADEEICRARVWIRFLERLDDRELLASVRTADPSRLGLGFIECALGTARDRLDDEPRRAETWARSALHALALSGRPASADRALGLALCAAARQRCGDLRGACRSFATARGILSASCAYELDVVAEVDVLEARLALVLGDRLRAEELLLEALTFWRELGDLEQEARSLLLLTVVLLHAERIEEAEVAVRCVLGKVGLHQNLQITVAAQNLAAELAIAGRRLDEAHALLADEPLLGARHVLVANRLALRGRLAQVAGDSAAETLLYRARALFERLRIPQEARLVWIDLALLHLREDNRVQAFVHALRRAQEALTPAAPAATLDVFSLIRRARDRYSGSNPVRSLEALVPPARTDPTN